MPRARRLRRERKTASSGNVRSDRYLNRVNLWLPDERALFEAAKLKTDN
jgi:hypothetical protein